MANSCPDYQIIRSAHAKNDYEVLAPIKRRCGQYLVLAAGGDRAFPFRIHKVDVSRITGEVYYSLFDWFNTKESALERYNAL